jgi:uncharacterized delta-60 repeat protein
MRRPLSPRRSRYAKPRLEALEDRFLLNAGTLLDGTDFNRLATTKGLWGDVRDIVLAGGKILVGATFAVSSSPIPQADWGNGQRGEWPSVRTEIALLRFNADGTLDTSFGQGGMAVFNPDLTDLFSNFTLQPDGKIVVVGAEVSSPRGYLTPAIVDGDQMDTYVWQDSGVVVARFNADGSYDPTFQGERPRTNPGVELTSESEIWAIGGTDGGFSVALQPDGKLVVAGQNDVYGNSPVILRYEIDGTLDSSFTDGKDQPGLVTVPMRSYAPYSGAYGWNNDTGVGIQSDGKIVFAAANPAGDLVAVRFNPGGGLDASFGAAGMAVYSPAPGTPLAMSGLVIQPDDKILLAGHQLSPPGAYPGELVTGTGLYLVRLDASGTPDSSFGQGGAEAFGTTSDPITSLAETQYTPVIDGNGRVAGIAQQTVHEPLFWGPTAGLFLQSDGKIVVAGSGWNSDMRLGPQLLVARFNADGSPDDTYGSGGVDLTPQPAAYGPTPLSIGQAPDGSFVVADLIYVGPFRDVGLVAFPSGVVPAVATTAGPPTPVFAGTDPRDAVFVSLAVGKSGLTPQTPTAQGAQTPADSPLSPSPVLAPLPVATSSASAAVAGLSGGGGESLPANDPFTLSGDPRWPDYTGAVVTADGPA